MLPQPLLQTKLYVPPIRRDLVSRPRLVKRLNDGPHSGRKLTLISAPAGYGKTTLVSEWVAGGHGPPAAWVSLDEGDNNLTRFVTYLVAALQAISADIGEKVLGLLNSPEPAPAESILTALVNEITTIPDDFALILDDYHCIHSQPVDDALTFLLEHLPSPPGGAHLVITTREDPNLPLARYRAGGQLTEVRVNDLRFTPSEAALFFNQVMGLDLSAGEVASLEARTEGWIAGLQLAALSMRGREDVSGFIRAFAGDNRYIVDYLIEEVLQRQPEHVRSFLLQTSLLDRLCGPLCDAVRFGPTETQSSSQATAVTGREEGNAVLEALERDNLFIVPLDDRRQWYRYHQLFADVLHVRLMEEQPDQVPSLHRRASEWYEDNGSPADAIRHALAGKDFQRAAGLVELAWREMDRSFQSATWLGWVEALPDGLIRAMPVLSAEYAWALLDAGELETADARLRDAERWLDSAAEGAEAPPVGMVVVDQEEYGTLPAMIANARAYHAQALGDIPGTVKYARQVLDLLPESDHFQRGIQAAILGLAYWASGDLDAAHLSVADGIANMRMAGNVLFAVSGTPVLADIRIAQGRLHEATRIYEQALRLAAEQSEPVLQGTADLHLGLSEIHHEQGDVEAATRHFLRSEELGEQAALPRWRYRRCLAQARIKEAQGDLDAALELIHEAERLHYRHIIPDVRPVAALRARVWTSQGRLAEAQGWVRERGLSVDDDLSYLREFEHATLARVLIARYKSHRVEHSIHGATGLLERLLRAAEEGGRTGSVIEILVLRALAEEAQSDLTSALASLEWALMLAEPEGYVRTVVDEGPAMVRLLREAAQRGIAPSAVARLLGACGQPAADQRRKAKGNRSSSAIRQSSLIEPLSTRELEVLALLATELTGPEIARELVVSLNTMRTHTKHIYGKLGVNNRRAAVRRAGELDLL